MPGITLATARTNLREYLEDKAPGTHWSDAELNRYLNRAAKDIWLVVRQRNTDLIAMSRKLWTWAANTVSYSFTTLTLGMGTEIRKLAVTPNIAAVSSTNLPVPCRQIPFTQLYLDRTQSSEMRNALDGGWTAGTVGLATSAPSYAIQGISIFADPIPSADTQFILDYFTPPSDISSDTSDVLPEEFAFWEELHCFWAASKAKGRTDQQRDQTNEDLATKMGQFEAWLSQRGNTGGRSRIVNDAY